MSRTAGAKTMKVGLSVGAASILYHYGRSLGGVDPPADAALP